MIDSYINAYGKKLYGLCLTLCADKTEADDLYQDTWLNVLKNIHRFDTAKSFRPWLTQICVNLFRNRLRRFARSPFFNGFATTDEKEAVLEGAAAPQEERYEEVRDAVDKLPEKLRITVILFYFEEMDAARVAKVLKIPLGTVKSRLNKARLLLKEALKNETDLQL